MPNAGHQRHALVLLVCLACSELHAAPRIGCAKPEFDFGVKQSSTSVDASFTIDNEGDEPLTVTKVLPGCGCTAARVAEKVIPPGGHTILTAQLSLDAQKGKQRKEVTIETNDPKTPRFQVFIVGMAVEPITVTPAEGVFFGVVDADGGEERAIELAAPTPEKAFHITAIAVGDKESLTTRYEEIEKEKAYRAYVKLAKGLTPGEFRSWVHVRTSNPKFSVVALPITATVSGDLTVAPSEIKVSAPQDHSGNARYISVGPGRVSMFKVTEVQTPLPFVRAKVTPMEGSVYRIEITGLTASKELDGKFIVIKTDAPSMSSIRIPIRVVNMGHPPATTPAVP